MDNDLLSEFDEFSLDSQVDGQDYSPSVTKLMPAQQGHLELLSHLASYSELLIVVTGAAGVGKTTLASALAAQREEPDETLSLTADLTMTIQSILSLIADRWDLPPLSESLVDAKEAIKQIADQRHANGLETLIVIDQAEQLSVDTLNDIAHLALLSPQALSFALFGVSGYETSFRESPTLAPIHVLALEPMSAEDSLLLAGQVFGEGAVTDDQVVQAHSISHGLPQKFLAELEDVLLNDSSDLAPQPEVKSSVFPITHILAVTMVAVVVIMAVLYQTGSSDSLSPEDKLLDELELPEESSSEEAESAIAFAEEQVSAVNAPDVATVGADSVPVAEGVPAVVVEHQQDEAPDFNYPLEEQAVVESGKNKENSVAVVDSARVTEVVAESRRYSDDELVLLSSAGYIVQLSGFHNQAAAQKFIERWQTDIGSELYLYTGTYQGKNWHVIVAGIYSDRAAATRAVAGMPSSLRKQSPWIRELQVVQKILKSRG